MSLSNETIAELQSLIRHDPRLLMQLQASRDSVTAARLLVAAAAANNIQLALANVREHFDQRIESERIGALRDDELEAVAGGGASCNLVFAAVFSLDVGGPPH